LPYVDRSIESSAAKCTGAVTHRSPNRRPAGPSPSPAKYVHGGRSFTATSAIGADGWPATTADGLGVHGRPDGRQPGAYRLSDSAAERRLSVPTAKLSGRRFDDTEPAGVTRSKCTGAAATTARTIDRTVGSRVSAHVAVHTQRRSRWRRWISLGPGTTTTFTRDITQFARGADVLT